jgi:TonB family protein
MKIRIIPWCRVAVLFVLCASPDAHANQEMLASAKNLYESASYEAALSELSAIDNTELVDIVDTYRALCLLGLGRARDAEQVLQLVVMRKPLLVLSDSEYSPRMVALFHDVRKKTLPAAAQRLYSSSRTDYENKNYDAAAQGFKEALQVIADAGAESQTATLADLKELASGFLALAEAKAVASAPPVASPRTAAVTPPRAGAVAPPGAAAVVPPGAAAVAAPPTAAPAAPPPAAAAVSPQPVAMNASPTFYTLADTGVTPPVVLAQVIPPWATKQITTGLFTGTLEFVVDEKGTVENATLVEPVWPPYDAALLHATRGWRYQPALKDGKPVKFKRVMAIRIDLRVPTSR